MIVRLLTFQESYSYLVLLKKYLGLKSECWNSIVEEHLRPVWVNKSRRRIFTSLPILKTLGGNAQQVAKLSRNPSYADEISGELGTGLRTAV